MTITRTKKVHIVRVDAPARQRKNLPPGWGPKGWGRRAKATGFAIIRELASHMNRLGYTPTTFAVKCEVSTARFLELTKRPHKLDLRIISLWSSIVGADLVVSPRFPQGYYGRNRVIAGPNFLPGIHSYLRAAKSSRILGTPFIKAKHLR